MHDFHAVSSRILRFWRTALLSGETMIGMMMVMDLAMVRVMGGITTNITMMGGSNYELR